MSAIVSCIPCTLCNYTHHQPLECRSQVENEQYHHSYRNIPNLYTDSALHFSAFYESWVMEVGGQLNWQLTMPRVASRVVVVDVVAAW